MSSAAPPPRRYVVGDLRAMASQTNIDRRTCTRVVPMKVLCLGVSRTGTSSLRQALIDLGYEDVYHYASILNENPKDAEMWVEAIKARFEGEGKPFTRSDWDRLLGHCMAVTDTPCAIFYKDLIEAYPEAKVILGVRDDAEQWWQSQSQTLRPFFEKLVMQPQTWSDWLYRMFMPPKDAMSIMADLLPQHYDMYRVLCADWQNGTKNGIKWYEDYVSEIQRIVPQKKLLVFNNREGWKPLCDFLGHEIPDWQYPKVNTTQEFHENMGQFYSFMDSQVRWKAANVLGGSAAALCVIWLAIF